MHEEHGKGKYLIEFISEQTKLSWLITKEMNTNRGLYTDISYFIEHNHRHN